LEISFETKSLRTLCEDDKTAESELGKILAGKLKRRLADLVSATNFHEVPAGNPRFQSFKGKEYLIIDLDSQKGIYLLPNHNNNPVGESGKVDWSRVNRVKIVAIE
jgi:proteic killer suppression protein